MKALLNDIQAALYWDIPVLTVRIRWKAFDAAVIIFTALASFPLSVAIDASYGLSTLLFFGSPALYLSLRSPRAVANSLRFSMLFAFPVTLLFSSLAIINKSWLTTSIFSFRVLGILPIEDLLWGFSFVYLTVIFYQHFFNDGVFSSLSKRMNYLSVGMLMMVIGFISAFLTNSSLLRIPYFYLVTGIVLTLMPSLVLLFMKPDLASKLAKTMLFTSLVSFLFEITALTLHQWSFPGSEFVGWVEFLQYRFPFEEFLFFIILGGPGLASFLVLFGDQSTLTTVSLRDD